MESEVRSLCQSEDRLGLPARRQPTRSSSFYANRRLQSSSTLLSDSEYAPGSSKYYPRRWSSLSTVAVPDDTAKVSQRPRSLPALHPPPGAFLHIDDTVLADIQWRNNNQWIQVYVPQGYRRQMALVPLSHVPRSSDVILGARFADERSEIQYQESSYVSPRSTSRNSFHGNYRRSSSTQEYEPTVYGRLPKVPPLSTESIVPQLPSDHQLWAPSIHEREEVKPGLFRRIRQKFREIFQINSEGGNRNHSHQSTPSVGHPSTCRFSLHKWHSGLEAGRRQRRAKRESQLFTFLEEEDDSLSSSHESQDRMHEH